MRSNVRRFLCSSAGLVVGGFSTFLAVNAGLEHQRDADVFNLHHNKLHYLIDALGAVACSSITYGILSFYDYRNIDPVDFHDHLSEPLTFDTSHDTEGGKTPTPNR